MYRYYIEYIIVENDKYSKYVVFYRKTQEFLSLYLKKPTFARAFSNRWAKPGKISRAFWPCQPCPPLNGI